MTRLSLVALTVAALAALAGVRLRTAGGSGDPSPADASATNAVRFWARRTWFSAAAWLVGGGGVVAATYGVLRGRVADDVLSSRGAWASVELVAFVLGAGSTLVASYVAARWASARESSDGRVELEPALRVAAAPALLSAAVSTIAFAASLVVAAWASSPSAIGPRLAVAVVAHAFGACIGGAVGAVAGRVFAFGAQAGSAETAQKHADPRNPAVVLDRLARRIGERAIDGVEIAEIVALVLVAATILAGRVRSEGRGLEIAPLLFPVVARAFGLVAAFVGVMAVKSADREEPLLDAIDRGSIVASGLAALGLVASAWWLLRSAFVGVACAGTLGIAVGWALSRFGRRASGAFASSVPTFVALALVPGAWACGTLGGARNGAFGVAVATLGLLSVSALPLAASWLATDDRRSEAAAHAMRISVQRTIHAASVLVVAVAVLAFVAAARIDAPEARRALDLGVVGPVAGVACMLGAALAVACAALARRASVHVAGATRDEIDLALTDLPRDPDSGERTFPIDFPPADERIVVNVALDAQLHGATAALLAIGAPVVVGLLARRAFGLGVEAVVALAFGAALVPLVFAPLSRAVSGASQNEIDATSSTPWLAFAARAAIAVALALTPIFL